MTEIGETPPPQSEQPGPQSDREHRSSSLDYIKKAQNAVRMNEMANRELKRVLRDQGMTEGEIEKATSPVTQEKQQQFAEHVIKSRKSLLNRGLLGKFFGWLEGD